MKQKIKLFGLLFISIISLALSSCERDNEVELIQKEKKGFKSSTITFKEVEKINLKAYRTIEKIQSKKNLVNARGELFGYSVDSLHVNLVEREDGFQSFTFKVKQDFGLNYFENIVFNNYPDGTVNVVLTKFNLNKPLEDIDPNANFNDSVVSIDVFKYDFGNQNFVKDTCFQIGYYTEVEKCEGELVTPSENPECFDSNGKKLMKQVFVLIGEGCTGGGAEDNGGINVGGTPTTPPPTTGNGGGSSGDPLEGIFIPNPYEGEPDLSNEDFQLSSQVGYFLQLNPIFRGYRTNNQYYWMHAATVDFVRNNGNVLNQANKDAINFSLTNFNTFQLSLNMYNWTNTSVARFKYWTFNYYLHNPTQQAVNVVTEIKSLAQSEINSEEYTLEFVKKSIDEDKIYNELDDNFLNAVDGYMDLDIAAYNDAMLANDPLYIHFTIQCAVVRAMHPEWNNLPAWQRELKVYWYASKEFVHITLDMFGLVPVVGEVADLANGVLYLIEGDNVNATLSLASSVPVAGWAAVGVKYAVRVDNVVSISSKVKLTWRVLPNNIIYFGSESTCRRQLRKSLGLLTGNANKGHHIIPLNKQTHRVVQKAAKSENAFHLNEALNGIPLSGAVHNGSHFHYDAIIGQKLNDFSTNFPNATPNQCYDKVTEIIQEVRTAIQNNPNTPINELNF
ncbi:AHH domain-containing protein [Flavobacterium sp. SM15]|uniref:AHH domain-containing protein n=1 Tax=Flavobacterium sp. SM15 TaxID=2908005 RepID=UPI001EDBFA2E|nr:AHH domain-containing protein [Flavobacterium sp. SM15]MCG2611491.1 AHH domain-containing protein [Flavobacterium sp. SM15]